MVRGRDGQIWPPDLEPAPPQPVECLWRRHFMDQVEIDVDQRRRALALRDDVTVPYLLDNGSRFHMDSHTARATSSVPAGAPFGFKSAVISPESSTLEIASFISAASFTNPNV